MVEGYKSVTEVASEWELSTRQVQSMCLDGKIPGAGKIGRTWAIPSNAERPIDGREKSGRYKNWRNSRERG